MFHPPLKVKMTFEWSCGVSLCYNYFLSPLYVYLFLKKKKKTSKPEIPNQTQTQTLSNHSHSLAIFEKIQTLNTIKYNEQVNNNNKQALISKKLG